MVNNNGIIYNERGNVASYKAPAGDVGQFYMPIRNTLQNDWYGAYGGDLTTDDALPQKDRFSVISWLRAKYRSNSTVAGIINCYATGIGSPKPRVNTADPDFNDLKERYLEDKLSRITWGSYKDLDSLLYRVNVEIALTGEAFLVKMKNGKVRIVPAELIGSSEGNTNKKEKDGIIYGSSGQAVKYRIGQRDEKGKVDYKKSKLVAADNVWHINNTTTAEESRAYPPLAASIKDIYDLVTIKDSKTESIKLQAAFSLFISKHVDPAVYSSIFTNVPEASSQALEAGFARSTIVDKGSNILYGEVGEKVDLLQPDPQSADFDQFYFNLIQSICSPLGLPVEEVLGYHRSNYSSSRAEKIKWKSYVAKIRNSHLFWLNDLQSWLVNRGKIDESFKLSNPTGSKGLIITWDFPHVQEIDEAKAAQANIALYNSGLSSRTEAAAKRGRYIDEVNQEQVNEAEQLVKMIKEKTGDKTPITTDQLLAVMNKGDSIAKALETLNKIDNE